MTSPTSDSPLSDDPLVGIEIGGTKLQIVVSAEPGQIDRRWRGDADRAGGGVGILRQIESGLCELLAGGRPRAIGVGFGGPVDVRVGKICRSHQVDGWDDFPLRNWLADRVGSPVVVENDSNAATLGEAIHGAGQGSDPVFYCNFGSGVGGGLVIDGDIYHGVPPGEAEFGHLLLDREGTTVESRCSGWAVDGRIRLAIQENPSGELARLVRASNSSQGGEARHWSAAIAAGDHAAIALLTDVAGDIAFALGHVVQLFHPGVIVVGGGLSHVGEPLRSAIESALPAFVMKAFHPTPPVRMASLGADAVPIGALELANRLAGK